MRGETQDTYAITQALGQFLNLRHRYDEAESVLQDGILSTGLAAGSAP